MQLLAIWAAALACLVKTASSLPAISFPINAQVPPVARITQPFSFIFASNTFTSSLSITYSLKDSPSWLSIDSDKRWLHGTPQDGDISSDDVVGVPVTLIATDETGSTSMNVTLVVSRHAAPTVKLPLSQQLEGSGYPYSEPSSLLAYPDDQVKLAFSSSTFSTSGLNYYAVSGDNSPLPSWLSFNADNITFTGTTPPFDSLVEPPQTFNFQLIASDVAGFSASAVSFSVVVGNHEITVDDPSLVLNASVGKPIVYNGFRQNIKFDGKPANSTNLTAAVIAASPPPDWLTFNTSTWEISGTPPSSAQNAAFAISFYDAYANTLNITVQVDIDQGTVFNDTLPNLQATRGSQFSLDLKPYLLQTTNFTATVQTQPQEDWIHFDNQSLSLSGTVPISESASSISVSVQASIGKSRSESQTFLLQVLSGAGSNPSSTTTDAPIVSPSAAAATGTKSTSRKSILLAVLIPTMLLCLVLIVVACCVCCRRRRKRSELSKNLSSKAISQPVPSSFAFNGRKDATKSMLALDKEFKVNNVPSICIQPAQDLQTNEKVQHPPDGSSPRSTLAPADALNNAGNHISTTSSVYPPSDRSSGLEKVTIPDFPVPPPHLEPEVPKTPVKASAGTEGEDGQWPFEESTLLSTIATKTSTGSHEDESNASNSHPDIGESRDALGIHGGGSSRRTRVSSPVDVPRYQVRSSTVSHGTDPSNLERGLYPETRIESQEAIYDEGNSSLQAQDISRSTLDEQDHKSSPEPDRSRGFLAGMAMKFVSRFRRSVAGSAAAEAAAENGESSFQAAACSPEAPSFDTDIGSVMIGDITTAQPYRPRRVFISSPNRITESPVPHPLRWTHDIDSQGSTAYSSSSGERQQARRVDGTHTVEGGNGDSSSDYDSDPPLQIGGGYAEFNEAGSNAGEAIHRDPPVPPLALLTPMRTRDLSLSQEIASSLGSRRRHPTNSASHSSGQSSISAAMEEVRSLLLLPYDTTGNTPLYVDGRSSRSSTSWETLASSEQNWTSVYNYGVPARRREAVDDDDDDDDDGPAVPSPLRSVAADSPHFSEPYSTIGSGLPRMASGLGSRQDSAGGLPRYQQHAQATHEGFIFSDNMSTQSPAHASEQLPAYSQDEVPGAYPESYEEAHREDSSQSAVAYRESFPHSGPHALPEGYPQNQSQEECGIGVAVSKYSQPHLGSHDSMASVASSHVMAFL